MGLSTPCIGLETVSFRSTKPSGWRASSSAKSTSVALLSGVSRKYGCFGRAVEESSFRRDWRAFNGHCSLMAERHNRIDLHRSARWWTCGKYRDGQEEERDTNE